MLQLGGACCIILGHSKQCINVTCKNMQCYELYLKSACAHMIQCCVIQEIAEHLMTVPFSAVESALQVHFARHSLLQSPRKDELDRNVSSLPDMS